MLSPQMREENVPLKFQQPICTGPMEVSPPTGSEMVAAILYLDKALLPVDDYLATEGQVIIEPASWSYDYSPNGAVQFCESLFVNLIAASSINIQSVVNFSKHMTEPLYEIRRY